MLRLVHRLFELEKVGGQVSLDASGVQDDQTVVLRDSLDDCRCFFQTLLGQKRRIGDDKIEGGGKVAEVAIIQCVVVEHEVLPVALEALVELEDFCGI